MQRMCNALEKAIVWFILPISLFLAFWWSSFSWVSDQFVFFIAFTGFCLGFAINALFLRKWLDNAYKAKIGILLAVFAFYSVCTFGFFMGVPLFNILPGIAAGSFYGKRLFLLDMNREKAMGAAKKASRTIALIMLGICISAAGLALKDPSDTARNLEGMLNLKRYSLTLSSLVFTILLGGLFLVFVQYVLAKKVALWRFDSLNGNRA